MWPGLEAEVQGKGWGRNGAGFEELKVVGRPVGRSWGTGCDASTSGCPDPWEEPDVRTCRCFC